MRIKATTGKRRNLVCMRTISNFRTILWVTSLFPIVCAGIALSATGAMETPSQALTNVAQFYRSAGTGYHANYTVQLEGVICWADPNSKLFVFQDGSGAVPIRADFRGAPIRLGERMRVEGECSAERSGLGFAMTQALVVDNDGLHPPVEKAGSVVLKAGLTPVRLVWFNSAGDGVLKVSYQGPGTPLQAIPAMALFRPGGDLTGGATNLVQGLEYKCWEGGWDCVPDFTQLVAVTNGAAAGFDVSVRTRPERVGLEFSGYLKAPQEGLYTFYVESDDGSLLFAGQPSLRLTALGASEAPKPSPLGLGEVLSEGKEFHRCEVEGEVRFVDERQRTLRLELRAGEDHLLVEIANARGAQPGLLQGARIRAAGICHGTSTFDGRKVAGYLWVPSWSEVDVLPGPEVVSDTEGNAVKLPLLSTIGQVRRLSPEAARRAYPARVQGVVTAVFESGSSLVIQDADQGIYIGVQIGNTRGRLEIGDLCEITGTTRSAGWAPMIDAQRVTRLGLGRLPEPLHPSWDQILNGSLDSQYVELQGIVTEVHDSGVKLLTRVGKIELDLGGKSREEWQRLEDALVRVRGCVLAVYDSATHLVSSGKIRFIHPSIAVDEFPPTDPFAIAVKRVAALRSFDPHASAFQRVKVAGQIVHANNGLYCLMDGTNGLHFFPKTAVSLPAGAVVEVVGIVDLSGPSPSLREAMVRQQGLRKKPAAMVLTGTNLLSGARDATLVRVESLLLNVSRDAGDQVLELRTGPYVHTARLNMNLAHVGPIPIGSRLALTGVYLGKGGNWAAGQDIEDFDLALSSPADITVLERPSWWTTRRLLGLVGSLAAVLLLALAWIRLLHGQVEERTRQLAQQIQARQLVEQQRALEQERTRLARDLHDDLGGGLTEISMLGFLANDRVIAPERKAGYLRQMTEKARQLVSALDEIVWAVNPRYDSLAGLTGYYSLYAQRFLSLASLACHLEVAERLPDCPLDSNVRHSLFLAFKEALNNVVRHAEASEVRLRILVQEGELIVSVTDNGRGLQPAAATEAGMDGLANMRERMSALGGRCEIRSAPAQGTTVLFGVRLPKDNHDQSSHN